VRNSDCGGDDDDVVNASEMRRTTFTVMLTRQCFWQRVSRLRYAYILLPQRNCRHIITWM